MERIREALNRARQERTNKGFTGFVSSIMSRAPKPRQEKQFTYSSTQTVKVSPAMLRENRIVSGMEASPMADAYKILCTQVMHKLKENGWNAIAITSPGNGEGKTLTAINLAISLAKEMDQTVLLVDADLRQPSVHTYFGLQPLQGLSDYLTASVPLDQMLIHPGINGLVILPGGKPLQNSSEMLGSAKMAELVQELKSRYPSRIVVFDLPPILTAADALAFSPYVDATMLVVEEGRTPREDVVRATEMLASTKLLGTVLNKSSVHDEQVVSETPWWRRWFVREGH